MQRYPRGDRPLLITTFRKELIEKSGKNVEIYCPKIEYHKYFKNKVQKLETPALENYIFCYHEDFNNSIFLSKLRFVKGLDYFLNGYYQNQNEIVKFIRYCKCSENKKGYLTQAFFKTIITKK